MIFHHKNQIITTTGGAGDGTRANPWYWYGKTSGQVIDLNNQGTSSDDKCRLYLRVKLLAGTSYKIGQTAPGGDDGMIWLYNEAGQMLISDDDEGTGVAGISCPDAFTYTPSTTSIYIIGAGAYSSSQGDYKVAIDPLPAADPVPSGETTYTTSTGFNKQGKAVKYRVASAADCAGFHMPSDGLIFYAPLAAVSDKAETGQTLSTYGTAPTAAKIGGLDCIQFNGSGYITASGNGMPTGTSPFTMSIWEYLSSRYTLGDVSCPMFSFGDHSGTKDIYIDDYSYSYKYRVGSWSSMPIVVNWSESDGLNKWVNLVVVNDGSTVYFYINGAQRGSSSVWFSLSSGTIDIGGCLDNSSWWLRGYLTAARIYNRALSQKQITTLSKEFTPTT